MKPVFSVVLFNLMGLGATLAQGGALSLEKRTHGLMLIALIILLGIIGIFTVVSLMFGWRKHIERHRMLAQRLREKHGDSDAAPDAWTLAAERGIKPESGDGHDPEPGDDDAGPGDDSGPDQGDDGPADDSNDGPDPDPQDPPKPPPLPPTASIDEPAPEREPTGDEDLIDIESGPPTFDLGLADTGYTDPYDDDDDEDDQLGEEWKQGTHYQFIPDPMDDIDTGDDDDDDDLDEPEDDAKR